ncbi:ATP-binding cassette domain-containing protein [Streptomyces sp. NPDC085466]|uniref:ATP-binding cassette domain-containing protein n=1 Tax=Streptomyces sp. NPDC085466 TaxID=3365725 RepID=UPI0037D6F014
MTPPRPTTVAVTGLTVRHRRTRVPALDGVDLRLSPGVLGLLGPNGAGKTSLVRVLATVAAPSAGRVELLGRDVGDPRGRTGVRRRLGYLPQGFGHYPAFTVREFVAYVAWLKEMPADRVPAAVERAVARVGLTDRIDARLRTLSGGMVRRAGIAQVLLAVWPYASWGRPSAGPLLADAVAVGAMGLTGHMVGRVVRWRLTAPLLAVVGYFGLAYADFVPRCPPGTRATARGRRPGAPCSACASPRAAARRTPPARPRRTP